MWQWYSYEVHDVHFSGQYLLLFFFSHMEENLSFVSRKNPNLQMREKQYFCLSFQNHLLKRLSFPLGTF